MNYYYSVTCVRTNLGTPSLTLKNRKWNFFLNCPKFTNKEADNITTMAILSKHFCLGLSTHVIHNTIPKLCLLISIYNSVIVSYQHTWSTIQFSNCIFWFQKYTIKIRISFLFLWYSSWNSSLVVSKNISDI